MPQNKVFKKVAIMGKPRMAGISETLDCIIHYLESHQREVVVEQETASLLSGKHTVNVVPGAALKKHCELIIVVGGDGSMLKAGRLAATLKLPVVGINRGRLGFLTDIHPNDMAQLLAVLDGEYKEETRFLLNASVHRDGAELAQIEALNDIILMQGDVAHMIDFKVDVGDQHLCCYRADGLIVATPTGSTAYALSAGGPISHPNLDSLTLVPLSSHALSSRPIVIPGDSRINITISAENTNSPVVSGDGQDSIICDPGTEITITKQKDVLHLIHPLDYSYYDTLRKKLRWEG